MRQVIMNLCTNAGHAMEEDGGVMEVSLQNADFGLRPPARRDCGFESGRKQIANFKL